MPNVLVNEVIDGAMHVATTRGNPETGQGHTGAVIPPVRRPRI